MARRTPAALAQRCSAPRSRCVAVAPARAQELRFRQLTPDAGLSSSYVQSIFQDRTGFLWFGTDKGLDRYDGYVIHSYRHRRTDPHSIADGTIHVLHADRGDTMWVGTNAGLSRYDADQDAFINYAIGGGERAVHGIADDARGGLWIAADDGLYRFDRATGSATPPDGAAGARSCAACRSSPCTPIGADSSGSERRRAGSSSSIPRTARRGATSTAPRILARCPTTTCAASSRTRPARCGSAHGTAVLRG